MKGLAILLAALNLAAHPVGGAKPTMLHRDMPLLGDGPHANLPTGFTPAPTPNSDIYAPRNSTGPAHTRWQPDIAPDQYQVIHPGSGWIPGSAFTDDRGRRHPGNPLGVTPTLNLLVPLD